MDLFINFPLTNIDLNRLLENIKIKNLRGVFMRDSLPNKINKIEAGIVNLDSKNNKGTHWVAYYKKNNKCYYFDSFGLDPPIEIKDYLENDIITSTFQIQKLCTNYCGHLCLFFLKLLEKHKFEDVIFFLNSMKYV